jgi:hypothetical protein
MKHAMRPYYWVLDVISLGMLLAALAVHAAPLTPTWHSAALLAVVLLGFGLIFGWLQLNRIALLEDDLKNALSPREQQRKQ